MAIRDSKGRFVKGHPGLKRKGARTRLELTKAFITDVANDWLEHGSDVLARLREENPAAYAKIAAQLVPRDDQLLIQHDGKVDVRNIDIKFVDSQLDQPVTIEQDSDTESDRDSVH